MLRFVSFFLFLTFFSSAIHATECHDIFPRSPVPHPLLSYDEHFINIPVNNANQALNDNTKLERGDNFYSSSSLSNGEKITVDSSFNGEVTARLYLKGSINWSDVKINEDGEPENLIIYINGTLEILGDETNINAIIYATGSISIIGNAEISGAVASEANINISSDVEIDYESEAIEDADFNGMCSNHIIPKCDVFFPGEHPFSAVKTLHNEDFKGISECNGTRCVINGIKSVVPRTPIVPSGGSNLGQYNRGSLSDEDYNFFNSWNNSQTTVKFTDSDGTAVIYIKSTNDILLPRNLKLNLDGEPANVLLVIESSTKIKINKGTEINAFLYLAAPKIRILEGVEIEGGITVDTANLIVDTDSTFDYDSDQLEDFEPHGFCRVDEPPEVISPLANFHFDECSYSGAVGEVIDQTTKFSGQAFQGVNTEGDGKIERFINFSDQSHHIQTLVPLPEEFSVSTWFKKPTSTSDGRYFVLGAMSQGGDLMYLDRNNNWRWGVYNLRGATNGSYSFASLDNNWHHLVLVYEEDETELYIDGVLVDTVERGVTGTLKYIGTSFDGPNTQGFRAPLDEFMIFDESLSEEEVEQIYTNQSKKLNFDGSSRTPVSCPVFDHFEIDTIDGEGLTCEADNIVIKACADSACNTLNNDTFSVNLLVNGVNNREVIIVGGRTTANYAHTTLGTAALSLNQAYQCKDSSDTACIVNFKDSGFVFSHIPIQLSGKPSNEGFNAATLSLKAVKTNTTTGVCDDVFTDNTDVTVNLSYSCVGGACQNLLALKNNGNSYNLTTTAGPRNLRFSDNSTAYFTLNYPHAAKFVIKAQKDMSVIDDDGNTVIKDFSATSNAFVERPFAFYLDLDDVNSFASDAMGSVFKKAGESFKIKATAVQWVDRQDIVPLDGIPDNFSVISNNNIAEGFNNETLIFDQPVLLQPKQGTEGTLVAQDPLNTFSESTVINSYAYSEVGIIELLAMLKGGNYLDACDNNNTAACVEGNIQGEITNVGRFTPDHFELVIEKDGLLSSKCNGGISTMPFVYNGQMSSLNSNEGAIYYSQQPQLRIIPKSSICSSGSCGTTENYRDDFMKLTLNNVKRYQVEVAGSLVDFPTADASQFGFDNVNKVRLKALYSPGSLNADSSPNLSNQIFKYNPADHFAYLHEKNSEIPPFDANIKLSLASIIDEDSIKAIDIDGDPDGTGSIGADNTVVTFSPAGQKVRFGRAVLDNSFGPETSNLPQPFHIQFLESIGNYVPVTDDKCTTWNSNLITLTTKSLNENKTSSLGGTGFFVEGSTHKIYLKAPSDAQGDVYVEYTVAPWLKYDWAYDNEGVDGLYNDNPRAVASFGVFRGNDRIIYHREIAH